MLPAPSTRGLLVDPLGRPRFFPPSGDADGTKFPGSVGEKGRPEAPCVTAGEPAADAAAARAHIGLHRSELTRWPRPARRRALASPARTAVTGGAAGAAAAGAGWLLGNPNSSLPANSPCSDLTSMASSSSNRFLHENTPRCDFHTAN